MKMCSRYGLMVSLLLCAWLTTVCVAQTFQYSRGWTNGKRSSAQLTHSRRDDDGLQEFFDAQQDGERKLEKCLLQLERLVRNAVWHPAFPATVAGTSLPLNFQTLAASAGTSSGSNSNANNNNIGGGNKAYGSHHQSNELYEELNTLEPNDYVKH